MPVYNEAAVLQAAVKRVLDVPYPVETELIIVDDGSTDGTRELYANWSDDPRVRVHLKSSNEGKGSAIRKAAELADGDYIIMCDADLEYSPEEYPSLIELICEGRADVVYGSRFLGRHRVFLFTHYLGNKLLTFITNVLYNTILSDMETCFKVMRVEVLRSFTLDSNGFGIEPELTAKIFKRRYRVYEIPITYDGRSYDEGKKITWRDGIVALWVLIKYRFTE